MKHLRFSYLSIFSIVSRPLSSLPGKSSYIRWNLVRRFSLVRTGGVSPVVYGDFIFRPRCNPKGLGLKKKNCVEESGSTVTCFNFWKNVPFHPMSLNLNRFLSTFWTFVTIDSHWSPGKEKSPVTLNRGLRL